MKKIFSLTTENIDAISQELFEFLQGEKQVKEDVIRARLSVETVLLHWLEHGNEGKSVTVDCRQRFRRFVVRLEMEGDLCDPVHLSEEDEAIEFITTLQGNFGLSAAYRYEHGFNIHTIKLPMLAIGSSAKIGLAIVLAVLTWLLVGALPPQVGTDLRLYVTDPTLNMLMGLVAAVATFLIFFNVCSAICGMGSLTTLSRLGGGLVKHCQLKDFAALLAGTVVGLLVFDVLDFSGGFSLDLLGSVYKIFLDVVPNSFLAPFMSGNTLQVLFLAVSFGTVLLILDQQVKGVKRVISEINVVLMTIIDYCCGLLPLMVYLSFTNILVSGTINSVLSMWKVIGVFFAVCGSLILFDTYWTALTNHFDIKKHFARVMPISVLAFTTCSTAACIPAMNKTLKDEGVDTNYRDFALPLCQIMAVPALNSINVIVVLGLLSVYNHTLSFPELMVLMLSVHLLAWATPPVAGGDISIMTLLLMQAGLPKETVATYIAISLFSNMIGTCLNKTAVMNSVFACVAKDGKIRVE